MSGEGASTTTTSAYVSPGTTPTGEASGTSASLLPTGSFDLQIHVAFGGSKYLRALAELATRLADEIDEADAQGKRDLAAAWAEVERIRVAKTNPTHPTAADRAGRDEEQL